MLKRTTGACVGILFLLGGAVASESIDLARQSLQKRESHLRHYKVNWEFTEHVVEEGFDPYFAFEAMRRSGAVVTEKEKQAEFFSSDKEYSYEDEIVIIRCDTHFLLQTAQGVMGPDGLSKWKIIIYYGDDYSIHFPEDKDGVIKVAPYASPAILHSVSTTQFVYPIDIAFLSNLNVLNIFQLDRDGKWRVLQEDDEYLVVEALLSASEKDSGYTQDTILQVGLAKQKGYAPAWAKEYRPSAQKDPIIEIVVTQWKSYSGIWMPSRIKRTRQLERLAKTTRELHLKHFSEEKVSCNIKEISNSSVGNMVLDHRVSHRKNIPYGLFGTESFDFVTYEWRGYLPPLEDLKRVQQSEKKADDFVFTSQYLFWIPPLILLAFGTAWLYKILRRQ